MVFGDANFDVPFIVFFLVSAFACKMTDSPLGEMDSRVRARAIFRAGVVRAPIVEISFFISHALLNWLAVWQITFHHHHLLR